MKIVLSSSLLLVASTTSTASHSQQPIASKNSNSGIRASSAAGKQLLRHARVEEASRFLNDNAYEDVNLGNMYLKYEGCSSFDTFQEETIFEMYQDTGNEESGYENWQQQQEQYQEWMNEQQANGNYNYNWQQQDQQGDADADGNGDRMLQDQDNQMDWQVQNQVCNQNWKYGKVGYQTKLARFTLCFDGGCNACSGKYAVDLDYFLPIWDEHRVTMDQFICQQLNNYCSNKCQYEATCMYTCMEESSGPSHCGSRSQYANNGGGQQFYLSNYLQCVHMNNVQNQWGNGNWQQNENENGQQQGQGDNTYIGPMCKDNGDLYLHTFYDEDCTLPSYNAKFQSPFQYSGTESVFPYFDEPFLAQNSCFSCEDEGELVNKLNEIAAQNNYQYVNQMNPQYYYQNVYQVYQQQQMEEEQDGYDYNENQDEGEDGYNQQQQYGYYYMRGEDDEDKTVGAMCEIFDLDTEDYSWEGYNINYEDKYGDDGRFDNANFENDNLEEICQYYGQDGDEFQYIDAENRVPVFKCVYSVDEPTSDIIQDCMFLEEVLPIKDGRDAASNKGFFSKQANALSNLLSNQRTRNWFLIGSIVVLGALAAFLFGTRPIDHTAAFDSKAESLVSRRGDMIVGRDIHDDDSAYGGKAEGTLA